MSARALVRVFVPALLLVLAFAGASARAAGMPAYGTKNFTPSPSTPSYFTDERGIPYAGPQGFPAPRAPQYRYPSAAAPARASGDLYARPTWPAKQTVARRSRVRPAHTRGHYFHSRAERGRWLRLVRLRRMRSGRLHRLRSVRLARARYKRGWRR